MNNELPDITLVELNLLSISPCFIFIAISIPHTTDHGKTMITKSESCMTMAEEQTYQHLHTVERNKTDFGWWCNVAYTPNPSSAASSTWPRQNKLTSLNESYLPKREIRVRRDIWTKKVIVLPIFDQRNIASCLHSFRYVFTLREDASVEDCLRCICNCIATQCTDAI